MSDQQTLTPSPEGTAPITPEVIDPRPAPALPATTRQDAAPMAAIPAGADIFMDPAAFNQAYRAAKLFAASRLVPEHLRGKVEDCMLAFGMARELGESPLIVMQNIYFVSGKAGWNATYMIARANKSGKFRGTLTWREEGEGEELAVTCLATLADTGEVVSITASMKMAHAEGWTSNKKYRSMPSQMLRYRSATMLVRLYAPEVMLGYHTADELEDVSAAAGGTAEQVNGGTDALAAELGVR